MARADIKAGRAYVELYVQKSAFLRGMSDARKELAQFGDDILSVGRKMAVAGGVLATALAGALVRFANYGSQLDDIAQRTGIAASTLAELGYAADLSGANIEAVEGAVRRMQKVIVDAANGSQSAAGAITALGLSVDDLAKLSPDQQFQAIADRIGEIPDATQRAAAAMRIFGKQGTTLLPMIRDLSQLRNEARELGLVPTDESVKAAAEMGDAFDRARKVVLSTFYEIGAAVAPMARNVTNFLSVFLRGVNDLIRDNKELIATLVRTAAEIAAVTAAIVAIGLAAKVASVALGLMLSILAGPRGMAWAAAGIVAASVAMQAFGDDTARTYDLILRLAQGGQITSAWEMTVQQMRVMWLEFTSSVPNAWNEMLRNVAKSVSRIQGFFGYDAEGAMKLIDQEFNEQQRKILGDLEAAQSRLRQLQAEAVNGFRGTGAGTAAGSAGTTAGGMGAFQVGGQRQIGTFSAAAFRAEQGGIDFEVRAQIEAIKKVTDAIDRGNAQNHTDLVDLARVVQKSGVVFG